MKILNSKYIKIVLIVFFSINSVQAQFGYRFEIKLGGTLARQYESLNFSLGNIDYYENSTRNGFGCDLGFSFVPEKTPFSLNIKYNRGNLITNDYTSNINVYSDENRLVKTTLGLNLELSPFKKSSIIPIIYIGANYSNIDLLISNINYTMDYDANNLFEWGYDEVEVKLNSIGYSCGVNIKFRLTDKLGIYIEQSIDFVNQDKSNWLEKNMKFYSCSIGLYLRFLKNKNYFK